MPTVYSLSHSHTSSVDCIWSRYCFAEREKSIVFVLACDDTMRHFVSRGNARIIDCFSSGRFKSAYARSVRAGRYACKHTGHYIDYIRAITT